MRTESKPIRGTLSRLLGTGRAEVSAGKLAVFMNLPSLAFMALVLAYPIYYAGYLSFHRVGLGQLRRGVFPFHGWANYLRLFHDDLFWLALQNTVVFTVITVATEIVLGIAFALLINQSRIWTSRITRLLILLPYAIPPIANGLIWFYIYNVKLGFLNRFLYQLGIIHDYVDWAGNANTALYAIAVAYIWRTVPFAILLFHAALQGIPIELFEASAVDGASAWERFWHVTLPMLRPIIVVVLVLRTSFAVMVFDEVMAITQGGPGDATWVAAWYSYKKSFAPPFDIGLGSASAYVMALLIGVMAILYVRFIYRSTD